MTMGRASSVFLASIADVQVQEHQVFEELQQVGG